MEQETLNITQIWYELSQGEGTKMYTLWRVVQSPRIYNRQFIQNLSIDKEQALEKAKVIAGDRDLLDESVDALRKIIRHDSGLVPFGKHYGKSLDEIPHGYLLWLTQGAPIEKETPRGEKYTDYLAQDTLKSLAIEKAKELGLFVEYKGEWISITLRDYLEKWETGWGHHFADKQKVTLELKLIKEAGYQSDYGWISIYTFEDTENRKFQYKGSTVLHHPSYKLEDGQLVCGEFVRKGDTIHITGTVKLSDYNSRQITYLQRIKVIPNPLQKI